MFDPIEKITLLIDRLEPNGEIILITPNYNDVLEQLGTIMDLRFLL